MSDIRSPQFGAILFRATELISIQGTEVFDQLGISLHANKISIVLALYTKGAMSSTELSKHIGISRQVLESRLKGSVKDGFFTSSPDGKDSRKRVYDISAAARPEAERIVAIMKDFEHVYDVMWQEIGIDLEQGVKLMERALNRQSLLYRLCDKFPKYNEELIET
ncbi:winged helix-turn-helix transcriptional regulator [Kordiimonas sp. SCSIO 12603]|uniref:MarR family winged helix-turn-helix transcriptional regulator n=1 Tax=Kordiimonas sp. SCSIO 12603 TaxID=2829596 RepID=UPI0021030043|nr:MarR family winged helix-turn-helix transcriptional regulator [Kordiimonas sp. SCSIO 12603]UTW57877.1 winged helix-turn-helix transcriptional regulator [Kordiimonas sp. SCSIO 12603]